MWPIAGRLERWKSAIEAGAALLPWLTGAAFVLGVGSISLIFWCWGISFLQVATPVDVLMASLVFTLRLMPLGIGMGLGSLSHLAPKKLRWVSYAASFACFVPLVALTIFAPRADWSWSMLIAEGWLLSVALHADHVFTKGPAMSNEEMNRFIIGIRRVAMINVPVLVIATLVGVGWDISENGFQGRPLFLQAQGGVDCPAQLLWLGSENAVLRCQGDHSRVLVISGHENLMFSNLL